MTLLETCICLLYQQRGPPVVIPACPGKEKGPPVKTKQSMEQALSDHG